ncbi:unnamed protein product, partial [Staurois parvus]
ALLSHPVRSVVIGGALCPITADHISTTCQCSSVPALCAHPWPTCQCPSVPHSSAHLSYLSVSPISATY